MEFSLLAAATLAVAATCGSLFLIHRGDRTLARSTCDLAVIGVIAGLGVGRVWAMVAAGTNPIAHPLDLLIVRGGVDTFAAATGALAAVAWSARHDLARTLDALAPGAAFGLAGWHAGCLARDACLGTPTGLPWGWAASPGGVSRHPVELYAALLLVVAGVGLIALWRRRPATGVAATAAVLTAALIRGVTEPLRPVLGEGRTTGYLVAAGLAGIALGLVWWRRKASRPAAAPGPGL